MSLPVAGLEEKYELLSKLKVGGMGAIYKVRHRLLDDIRVIKVMRHQVEQRQEFEERFRREARTAIRLHHDNIIQFYDFSVDRQGNAFIVMEFIDGVNLLDLLRTHGPPPLGLTLEVARQSLKAVSYLHAKGIVHRDISPDNLMLTRDDEGNPRVKLIDLGVAKVVEGGGELTTTGIFIGKLKYCSPEQLRRDEGAEVTPRSDLYSFAVVLYELLTGTLPIRGDNLTSIMAGHLFEPPVPFSESDPEGCVPEDLRRIVLTSLAKNPDARHESARHMARELASVQARLPFAAADLEHYLGGAGENRVRPRRAPAPPSGVAAPVASPGVHRGESEGPPGRRAAARGGPNRRRCEALFAEARRLAAEGHLAQAASQVRVVMQLDPHSPEARELLQSIEEQRQARARESRRVQTLTSNLDLIARAIEAGDLEGARESLAMARRRFEADPRLDELQRRLARAEEAAALRRLEELRAEARVLAEVYQFDEALALMEEAARDAPVAKRDTIVRQMEEIRAARRNHEAQEQREREVAGEAAAIEALLDRGSFDEARAALDRAESRLGAAEVLTALRERTEVLEEQRRDAEVARLLTAAREAVERGEFDEGMSCLRAALEERPDDVFLLDVLETTRGQAEESRRVAARRAAAEDLEERLVSLLGNAAWDEASRIVEEFIGRWDCGEEEAEGLRRRVSQAQARVEAARRARELLDSAQSALDSGELVAALDALGDVRGLEVDDPGIVERLHELDASLREELAVQQEARELAAAVERVTRCLAERDAEGARRALAVAERQFGHAGELDEARQQLLELERYLRLGPAGDLVERARRALEEGRYQQAIGRLNEAATFKPGEPVIEAMLRDARVLQAVAAIEKNLADGSHEVAWRGLVLARKILGDDPRLDRLAEQMEGADRS